jgi:hypothetical protein
VARKAASQYFWNEPFGKMISIAGITSVSALVVITDSPDVFVLGVVVLTVLAVGWTIRKVKESGEPMCQSCWANRA